MADKLGVELTFKDREVFKALEDATRETIKAVGVRVKAVAQEIVPQPPALSAHGRKRTGMLRQSLRLTVREEPTIGAPRFSERLSTGRGRNGFNYGAAVEGLIKPSNRPYTSTPFEKPALEQVAPEVPEIMKAEAAKRATLHR